MCVETSSQKQNNDPRSPYHKGNPQRGGRDLEPVGGWPPAPPETAVSSERRPAESTVGMVVNAADILHGGDGSPRAYDGK